MSMPGRRTAGRRACSRPAPGRPTAVLGLGIAAVLLAGCASASASGGASGGATGAPGSAESGSSQSAAVAPPDGGASPTPTPEPYDGPVFALGDSVMLGAEPCLEKRGYDVDAQGSRQISAGIDILRDMRKDLPPRIVVHLGTNLGVDAEDIDKVMRIAGPDRQVTWVTIQLPNDYDTYTFEDSTNAAIRAAALRFPNARVVDWNDVSGRHDAFFWGDGYHLTPKGCKAYARLVDEVTRA